MSDKKLDEVLDAYAKVNRINDELEFELRKLEKGEKLEPEVRQIMKEKVSELDTLLPIARKINSATGGDVIENIDQTIEDTKNILTGKKLPPQSFDQAA